MTGKKTTYILRRITPEYWQIVREFCVHRRITIRSMIFAAIDEYMVRHRAKERKQRKEL